jgi:redox-sensitive bicupin YhaK (pirin superfamily)
MCAARRLEKVPADSLFVSEPNPVHFGNGPNEPHKKGWTNDNWLKSRFHFSFAEYRDAARSQWGVLRVMNDDLVQPSRGFGTHGHSNMEICTYVIEGSLTHKDSMGTVESLGRGSIQFMTAGTGVRHSEHNLQKDSALRFIQMWITPRAYGLPPNYGSMPGKVDCEKDTWAHLVSDVANDDVATPVNINQDANIHVAQLSPGTARPLSLAADRQAYVLCMEGAATVALGGREDAGGLEEEPVRLVQHDALRVFAAPTSGELLVTAGAAQAGGAHVLVVEMAASG